MDTTPNGTNSNLRSKPPFQFRLTDALLATAWLAGVLAILTQAGEATPLFVIAWCAIPLAVANRRGMISAGEAAAVWCILASLCFLIIPGQPNTREAGRRNQCLTNMHQVLLALQSYEGTYGCLPPAYTADAQGKPMHSWRVLILPYMQEQSLYDQYDLAEPWDGPNNKKLHSTLVGVFSCPSDNKSPGTDTSYVAIVGPGTAWPGATSTSKQMVTDGLSDTILLVEVANSGIHWMEPRDLPIAAVSAGINPTGGSPGGAISSEHPGVVNTVFMDGRCIPLAETMPADVLHALLTIRGGERLSNNGDGYTILPPVAKPQASP